jgi:Ferritin-like
LEAVTPEHRERVMPEPRIVVEHREHMWYLLAEATQLEHMIMCQYLYAAFSMKRDPAEGLTPEQAAVTQRWHGVLRGIAIEEMLHLALVCNLMSAIGAAPTFTRPNFPQRSAYFPPSVQLDLVPFGTAALTHFLYLERPEGMERVDAEGFEPMAPPHAPAERGEVMPRTQDFLTVGHLYRAISRGFSYLAGRLGEHALFVGPPQAQATPEMFRWPELVAVTDLGSAHKAIETIIEQGEGARGDWRQAHYGRFLGIWEEYARMHAADPAFEPARPVIAAFTRQPFDVAAPQPLITDPVTRQVATLFALGYETLLQVLTRFFTHTDETAEQLDLLVSTAFSLMSGVLEPLGSALTRLPAGPEYPGRTAGPAFEMFYPMGNFVPWHDAAWAVLSERVSVLARQCADAAGRRGMPATVRQVADGTAGLAARLAGQVPAELRSRSA